jgi:hypothetical protein
MVRFRGLLLLGIAWPSAADVFCTGTPGGWTCPENAGCLTVPCTSPEWQEWVAATNLFRCMHDVPPAAWSEPMAADIATHFEKQVDGTYSDSYYLPPPLGPAGESIFLSSQAEVPITAVRAWYAEVDKCAGLPEGCDDVTKTAHFTNLVWDGGHEIGCSTNVHKISVCRYRGTDTLTCKTPNVEGAFASNVFPAKQSLEACKAILQSCGLFPPPFSPEPWETGFAAPVVARFAAPVVARPVDTSADRVIGQASMPDNPDGAMRLSLTRSRQTFGAWSMQDLRPVGKGSTMATWTVGAAVLGLVAAILTAAGRDPSGSPGLASSSLEQVLASSASE